MSGKQRRWPAAAFAGGLAALVALAGCGGERSVASKSAEAFLEAQKKGETFEDTGHAHGGHAAAVTPDSRGDSTGGGHEHEEAAAGAGAADHARHGSQAHAGHAGMDHDQSHQGHAEPRQAPGQTAGQDEHAGPMDHASHSPAQGTMAPDTAAVGMPEAVSPGQPAGTLKPDALDAPAATSVADAQRAVEIAEEMSGAGGQGAHGGHEGHGAQGGHGGHGSGTYVHVDAGREMAAQEESHAHHGHGMAEEASEVYVCPMHPEVTSSTPGKCPKCGMDLVKRRKE